MELVENCYPLDPRPATWTVEHSRAAAVEGWDLFDSGGSGSGPVQVQAFDVPEEGDGDLGGEDTAAWVLVRSQHGKHHRMALEILKDANPLEYQRIMQWPANVHGHWSYATDTVVWGADE